MAWNKDTGKTVSDRVVAKPKKNNGIVKGVIAAVIVVVGACAAWFVLSPGEAPVQETKVVEKKTKKPAKQIVKSEKKVVATNVAPVVVEKPVEAPKLSRHEQSLTNAYRLAAEGKIRFIPNKRRENRIFTEISDLQIERLLRIQPGQLVLVTLNYDRFVENFKKSLNTPIVIKPDDSDEVKEMKQAVQEVRNDLEKRMNAGEDIAAVMRETDKEFRRLSQYRFNLETEIRKARSNPEMTEENMRDYVKAANMMLKENGLPELKYPEMWFRNRRLRQQKENKQ